MPIAKRKLMYLYDTGICHLKVRNFKLQKLLLHKIQGAAYRQHPVFYVIITFVIYNYLISGDRCQCRMDTSIFSWRWARGCPKHVDNKINKYIKQNCAPSWTYLRDVKWNNSAFIYCGSRSVADVRFPYL